VSIRGPAYRITTERLVLRCVAPSDAPLLDEVVARNRAYLARWMRWAREEPLSLDERIERLRRERGAFDLGTDYRFHVFTRDERRLLAATGLHLGAGPCAAEIGYWIDEAASGQGFAGEAAGALAKVWFTLGGIDRLEIHCDPANARSIRVPVKLGFTHEATLRRRTLDGDDQLSDSLIWSLFLADLPATPVAHVATEAFDAAGRRLL